MPIYSYKVITPDKGVTEGQMTSFCALWVKFKLRRDKNIVLFVRRGTGKKTLSSDKEVRFLSISSMQQILFYRNLAMMLDAGISVSNALQNLAHQASGFGVQKAIQNVYYEVSNGNPLSQSIGRYPKISPTHITKTIEVGEQSGTLAPTLDRISQDLEKTYELRRKVIGAIAYPLIITFFMIVTAVLLIVIVLPQIIKLFVDLNADIPPTTRFLQVMGEFISTHPIALGAGILGTIVAFILLMRVYKFRLGVHYLFLRTPIFGSLIKEYSLSVFTRALGTLLSSGVTFIQALDTVKGTLKNESYIKVIGEMYPAVLQGGSFSDAMRMSPFHFPEQFRYLVEVGEQTGQLKKAFEKASAHYERSVMFQTQMLTTILEPILMLIAGVLVGFLALSIFGPIYEITTHMA